MAMESYVLAGGCFWCLDAVYRTLKGVDDVVSGYTGGSTPNYSSFHVQDPDGFDLQISGIAKPGDSAYKK